MGTFHEEEAIDDQVYLLWLWLRCKLRALQSSK